MEIVSKKRYMVMQGEPHLGSQTEMVVEITREEIIETLIEAFQEGLENTSEEITIRDEDFEQTYDIGSFLSQEDIDTILFKVEVELLDDDLGTNKHYDLIYSMLDNIIPLNFKETFEVIEDVVIYV
jgi:hypothetical protein